jgi:hypothetical protein
MYVEREREREKDFSINLKGPKEERKRWRVECVRRIPSPNSCALTHTHTVRRNTKVEKRGRQSKEC